MCNCGWLNHLRFRAHLFISRQLMSSSLYIAIIIFTFNGNGNGWFMFLAEKLLLMSPETRHPVFVSINESLLTFLGDLLSFCFVFNKAACYKRCLLFQFHCLLVDLQEIKREVWRPSSWPGKDGTTRSCRAQHCAACLFLICFGVFFGLKCQIIPTD